MNVIFDARVFPILAFLLSISIALLTWKLGADPAPSIIVGILGELILIADFLVSRLTAIEAKLGYSRGIASMSELIPRLHNILRSKNRWVKEILDLTLRRFSLEATYLENKRFSMTPEDFMDFAERMYQSMGNGDEMSASSLFGGGDYWQNRYGMRYAQLNREAADRGAQITRIFVPRNDTQHEKLLSIYEAQSGHISVQVAQLEEVQAIDRSAAKDFLVLNDDLVVEFIFSADFSYVDHIDLILADDEIASYCAKMRKLRSVAVDFQSAGSQQ